MEIKKEEWEKSYERGENFIFYPKEEVVKFINRFIKKRVSFNKYTQILPSEKKLKGLDFGCGIGRTTILFHEFDIEGYGIDISQNAIENAKIFAKSFNFDLNNFFQVYNGKEIFFDDEYFDFIVSDCVLDSMPFELAKKLVKDIDRITKKYFFISLISMESKGLFKCINNDNIHEIEVNEEHEKGTIQSLFNKEKIDELIKDTNFKIKWCELHNIENYDNYIHGRWYLVLEK